MVDMLMLDRSAILSPNTSPVATTSNDISRDEALTAYPWRHKMDRAINLRQIPMLVIDCSLLQLYLPVQSSSPAV
jgi:hypothetical protein